jgi:hypothetical protein
MPLWPFHVAPLGMLWGDGLTLKGIPMSNKPWKNPANPDYKSPAVDASTAAPPEGQAPPETATSTAGTDPRYTPVGAGKGFTDLRQCVCGLPPTGEEGEPIGDGVMEAMLDTCEQFLWQLVQITSRVLETVQIGDVRKLVAAEMAMPGCVVLQDGTISEGKAASEPAARSRGGTHPLVALLRLATQAVRLLRQLSLGTHPHVHNKRKRNPEQDASLDAVERAIDSMLKRKGVT